MVWAILARAAVKQVAKRAAKTGAKKAAKTKAARGVSAVSDSQAYNARRRYYRSSQRYLDKAKNASGATAAKYRQLARQEFENALGTYDAYTTQKMSGPMRKIANELGIDVQMRKASELTDQEIARIDARREKLVNTSKRQLEKNLRDPKIRREREARALLNNDSIGSRILGGTVDIWRDEALVSITEEGLAVIDNSKILPALYDYFGVDNLPALIDKLEDIVGDSLYKSESDDEMYQSVKLMLQKHIKGNKAVR